MSAQTLILFILLTFLQLLVNGGERYRVTNDNCINEGDSLITINGQTVVVGDVGRSLVSFKHNKNKFKACICHDQRLVGDSCNIPTPSPQCQTWVRTQQRQKFPLCSNDGIVPCNDHKKCTLRVNCVYSVSDPGWDILCTVRNCRCDRQKGVMVCPVSYTTLIPHIDHQ